MKKTFFSILASCCLALTCNSALAEDSSSAKALFYNPSTGTNSGVISGHVVQSPDSGSGGQIAAASGSGGANGSGVAYSGVSNYYDRLDNPGVHYWIELIRPGSSNTQRVTDRRVFKSGERIRIHVSCNAPGMLHAVHMGSSGREKGLPVSMTANNVVEMGKEYVVPAEGGWLRFDNKSGKESIRFVLVPGQMPSTMGAQVASVAHVNNIFDQYASSKSLTETVIEGTKDLVVEGAVNVQVPINRYSGATTPAVATHAINTQVSNAPGRYVVNTASEPVAVEINLKHQ